MKPTPSGSPSTPTPGLRPNPEGLLVFYPVQTILPHRPATVMPSKDDPSSRDFSLLIELVMSDNDAFVDVDDGDVDDDDDDDDGLADNNDDMDAADTPAQSSSSPRFYSIALKESIPLTAAVRRAPAHRKTIGCQNPGKLSSLSAPSRKPITPNPVASRKKLSANSSASSSKSSENAPA